MHNMLSINFEVLNDIFLENKEWNVPDNGICYN